MMSEAPVTCLLLLVNTEGCNELNIVDKRKSALSNSRRILS